ncbi:hypothetical protein ACFLZX_04070 [Nanoarchaeota archaeon]
MRKIIILSMLVVAALLLAGCNQEWGGWNCKSGDRISPGEGRFFNAHCGTTCQAHEKVCDCPGWAFPTRCVGTGALDCKQNCGLDVPKKCETNADCSADSVCHDCQSTIGKLCIENFRNPGDFCTSLNVACPLGPCLGDTFCHHCAADDPKDGSMICVSDWQTGKNWCRGDYEIDDPCKGRTCQSNSDWELFFRDDCTFRGATLNDYATWNPC